MSTIPKELRELILDALDSVIGTYSNSVGRLTPAISVIPPALSNERNVSGLEVTINKTPSTFGNSGMLNSRTFLERFWTVRLVNHDSQQMLLQTAIELLLETFYKIEITILDSSDFAPEQAIVIIPENAKLLSTRRL